MSTLTCPICHDGELEVAIDSAPQTFHYPGHVEVEVLSQSCDCDVDPASLYEDAMRQGADDMDAAYDAWVDDQLAERLGK